MSVKSLSGFSIQSKNMNSDTLLNPLRLNLRQGNTASLQYQLTKVLKRSQEPDCSPRTKFEIYLEVVKAHRTLNQLAQAVQLCDLSIANIPAGSFDLLSALKRLRSLLYLDSGDTVSARSLIEETDGLEVVLQNNQSIVNRSDIEVMVETWLVSVEVALAQKDLPAAQTFFEKAVARLASEESQLRLRRISFIEKRKLQQYYHDISQILNLFALTLQFLSGDGEARTHLRQLAETVAQENILAMQQNKFPNFPLHAKLRCLTGEYFNADRESGGISTLEARRWSAFTAPDYLKKPVAAVEPSIIGEQFIAESSALTSFPDSRYASISSIPSMSGNAEKALTISASALEKMAAAFAKIEKVLPNFENYLRGGSSVDYTQRGFSGHLMDTDLPAFLFNIDQLIWTGCLKLAWKQNNYESAIMKGLLPEIVRSGEAYLYAAKGLIVDAVFKGQTGLHNVEQAQDNFMFLTRMCQSIHVDDIRPDILGTAVPSDDVAERQPLIKIHYKSMIHVTTDLEEVAAGIKKDDGDATFFESNSPPPANLSEPASSSDEQDFDTDGFMSAFTDQRAAKKVGESLADKFLTEEFLSPAAPANRSLSNGGEQKGKTNRDLLLVSLPAPSAPKEKPPDSLNRAVSDDDEISLDLD